MDTNLGVGEQLVKSWDYAISKGRFFKNGEYNLKLTDKRIISTSTTKRGYSRTDIKTDSVSGVSLSTEHGSIVAGIICIVLGIILVVAAILTIPYLAIAGAVLILGGVIKIMLAGNSLSLNLYVESYSMPFITANGIKRRKHMRTVRVKVNRGVAEDIVTNFANYLLLK